MSDSSDGIRGWAGPAAEEPPKRTGKPTYTSSHSEASLARPPPRPQSAAGSSRLGRLGQSSGGFVSASSSTSSTGSSSGAVDMEDFQRAFSETPEETVRLGHSPWDGRG